MGHKMSFAATVQNLRKLADPAARPNTCLSTQESTRAYLLAPSRAVRPPTSSTISAQSGPSSKNDDRSCRSDIENHSITLSARSRKDSGIDMPSALAVFRLIESSNFVGA
jgi:hypothetical protein